MTESAPTTLRRRTLHEGWTLALLGGPAPADLPPAVPATVPGTVHTDLLAAGLIPDPYLDDNEALLKWIGLCDWSYRTSFEWSPSDATEAELVFEGLDTIAEIRLNGTEVARARNQHRSHRVDVQGALVPGENLLEVVFRSPVRAADAASLELGFRPHANHHPYNSIRKAAYSFGWDWGIDTATSGIWRAVRLEEWATDRLRSVRPVATVDGSNGKVDIHVEMARGTAGLRLEAVLTGPDGAEVARSAADAATPLSLTLNDPELWWPRGYGTQPLYDLTVELTDDGVVLDHVRRRVGFRTVRLDTTPEADGAGTPFTIVVNDRPVLIKGANWIPDDAFLPRVDRPRYAARLDQAEFAGLNLLRVWGGGIYESDDFYDECDERGILAWQDFLFACAAYSEDEPLRSEIEAEARSAIERLSSHPSLVLFNGNNENVWGFEEWGWQDRLDGKTWGETYYFELLPRLMTELAPHVGYTHASPFSPSAGYPGEHPQNDPVHGSVHIWDVWNQLDWTHYRDYRPRFVAEFGWQAPPAWRTLTRALTDDPLTPESPGMIVHQKAIEGNRKLTDGLLPHLRLPDDMKDWHWAMQLNQADAVQTGIEWFRSLQPHSMGTIVWQLNDCWPVTSWAAVDGDGRAKPLLHALRRAHRDRLLTVHPRDGELVVTAANDTDVPWQGELRMALVDFDGTVIGEESVRVVVPARSARSVSVSPALRASEPPRQVLRVELDGGRTEWFFAEYRDLALPAPEFDAEWTAHGDGGVLRVTARTLLVRLTLLIDKADPDASTDDALATLLPGETTVFRIQGASRALALDELTAPHVLRSANQLVTPPAR